MMQELKIASARRVPGPYLAKPYLPQVVDPADYAFPALIGFLSPDPADIPDEFWHGGSSPRGVTWNGFMRAWFFGSLPKDAGFWLRDGVDGELALRHLSTILRSFEPKHEHKEAMVAYLASLWFYAVVKDEQVLFGEPPKEGNKEKKA